MEMWWKVWSLGGSFFGTKHSHTHRKKRKPRQSLNREVHGTASMFFDSDIAITTPRVLIAEWTASSCHRPCGVSLLHRNCRRRFSIFCRGRTMEEPDKHRSWWSASTEAGQRAKGSRRAQGRAMTITSLHATDGDTATHVGEAEDQQPVQSLNLEWAHLDMRVQWALLAWKNQEGGKEGPIYLPRLCCGTVRL